MKETSGQIIEFEGLAGCGKSTLCTHIKKTLELNGYTVFLVNEKPFDSYFKKHECALIRFVQTFSIRSLKNCIALMFNLKVFKEFKKILQIYKTEAVFRHFKKHSSEKSVLVCDQSIIQTIVALWGYDTKKTLTSVEQVAVSTFFESLTVTHGFLCELSIDENLKRIRKRARTHGRLDLVNDDTVLYNKLQNNYNTLTQIVDLREKLRKENHLNMIMSPDSLSAIVLSNTHVQIN